MKGTKKQLVALSIAIGVAVAGTSGASVAVAPASSEVGYLLSRDYGQPAFPSIVIGGAVGNFICGLRCSRVGAK